ncbi:MAG: dihydropyrimidinase [Chloroflexota bacterium]
MHDIVIKNGRVVTASTSYYADVAVSDGKIAAIGTDLHGAREINAAGMLVTPGAVDIHVHMEMSLPNGYTSSDDFFTGTRAAALGGTTAIVDFAECAPDEPMLDALARRRAVADPKVVIDYGLHMTVGPNEINKLDQISAAYDAGCASFKLYMAYGFYLNDGELLQALAAIQDVGGLPVIHAENWHAIGALVQQANADGKHNPAWHARTRPAALEGEAVGRAIDIATYVGSPLHIFHVGCQTAVERINAAKAKGLPITAETCPQYLALTDAAYNRQGVDGALNICAPPLRSATDRSAMWRALAHGALDIVATDHCPFVHADKKRGFEEGGFSTVPGGVPSIEVRYALVHSEGVKNDVLTENQWVELCCTRPAALAGFARKGQIAPGFDADICVFDPRVTWTVNTDSLHENCDWTPYGGITLTGRPVYTLSRGRVIVDNGEIVGEPGSGQFVRRAIASAAS